MNMKKFDKLKILQNKNGITRIILNDSLNYNALSFVMIKSLTDFLRILNKDKNSKVIIIEG